MNWSRILQAAGAIVLLVVVAVFVLQAFPGLIGAEYSLVVQSGSMEPAIGTGSVVFVADTPVEQVEEGDVITYLDDGSNFVTHRVIEKHQGQESLRFVTKGDANDAADAESVFRGDYVGKVILTIPLIGYVVAFGQTVEGWFVMVFIPVALLIVTELWSLYRAMEPEEETP